MRVEIGEVRTFRQNWKPGGEGEEPFLAGAKVPGVRTARKSVGWRR